MSDGLNTWYKLAGSSNADMNIQSLVISSIGGSGAGLYNLNAVSSATLQSSLLNLTSYGFISTNQLTSTVTGLQNFVNTDVTSTIIGLGTLGYVSTVTGPQVTSASLASTVAGLATSGYLSTTQLTSTVLGLQNFINTDVTSSIVGLGTVGYVSSFNGILPSTVKGLGSSGYLSSYSTAIFQGGLTSTIAGLGSLGYISSANVVYNPLYIVF
jgi:hypothetical protein